MRSASKAGAVIAETARLTIREVTVGDASFICRLLNEPSWLQNIDDRGVRTIADAQSYIESRVIRSYQLTGFGMYLVELTHQSLPIGTCGLVKREALPLPDLGFAFLPQFWGQGYAREAACAMVQHAREHLRIPKLLGIVKPDNERSCRLLEALGFALEGTFRPDLQAQELQLYAVDFRDG